MPPADAPSPRGHTVSEVAARYRVGEDKVRLWIKSAVLKAVNTADVQCGKPRYVITPEALVEFERVRAVVTPEKAIRRPRQTGAIDFFPD